MRKTGYFYKHMALKSKFLDCKTNFIQLNKIRKNREEGARKCRKEKRKILKKEQKTKKNRVINTVKIT